MTQLQMINAQLNPSWRTICEEPRKFRRIIGASAFALAAAITAQPAIAQEAVCKEPGAAAGRSPARGVPAAARLRDRDPLVRDMARADLLEDEGKRDEAAAIYRRLAEARPDRRQTARRAKLRLAQLALSAKDFASAESYVRKATGPGAPADLQARGRQLTATIAFRREVAAAEAALDEIDALTNSGRFDEAVRATQTLLLRRCPYPPDYPARVRTRLAQVYRAKGDFQLARATALDAQASATTPTIRQGTDRLIGEIEAAALAAEMRGAIGKANALIAAGDSPGAIAILEPMIARPDLPADIDAAARIRLARAYTQTDRFDAATATLDPLLARSPAGLDASDYETITRIYLARANNMQEHGNFREAGPAYRQILGWDPPVSPEVRDSARLGLARVLARQGDRTGALEQVALVRTAPSSARLLERANNLLADLEDETPLNRLVGFVEVGIAYDSNVPTLVSALEDDGDDLPFPADQRFEDFHTTIAGSLQYRHQIGQSDNYLDLAASALRSFQFDLPELDRTRLRLSAAPVISVAGGSTRLGIGGKFDIEWRGDRFRSSEPGIYASIRHELGRSLSATATYTLGWHNDYREERDGVDHSFDTEFRYKLSGTDVLRFNLRAIREGAEVERFRNWRLLAGMTWRHRWRSEGRVVPFAEVGANAERVIYDGLTNEIERRDWRLRLNAEVGAELDRKWQAALHYAYYDISSNVAERDRIPNHQVGVTLRFSWN